MAAQYFTPKYITYEDVEWQIKGKVPFTAAETGGSLTFAQVDDLCAKSERKVEQDMSERYATPFQDITAGTYAALSVDTRSIIVKLCVAYACYTILFKFFGSSGNIKGDLYWRVALSEYKTDLQTLTGKNKCGLFESARLSDLAINCNKYTGQDSLPGIRVSDAVKKNDFAKVAASRVTNPRTFPFWRSRYTGNSSGDS